MNNMKAVFPGSFDPITLGHIDIIERMSKFFSELVVLIGHNTSKKYLCTVEEREKLAKTLLKPFKNVKVDVCNGLTVDYAQKNNISLIIRGLRGVVDSEFEFTMAAMNIKLNPDIETIMVCASPQYALISSSLIKEIILSGGSVKDFIPQIVEDTLRKKLIG